MQYFKGKMRRKISTEKEEEEDLGVAVSESLKENLVRAVVKRLKRVVVEPETGVQIRTKLGPPKDLLQKASTNKALIFLRKRRKNQSSRRLTILSPTRNI